MLKKNSNIVFLSASLIFPGCGTKDDAIISVGLLLVLMFLLCWALSTMMPKIQDSKIVKYAVEKIKTPICFIANTLIAVFFILSIVIALNAHGASILLSSAFVIAIVGLHYLKKLASSDGSTKHPVELKMVVFSISFMVSLFWLIFCGAKYLRL